MTYDSPLIGSVLLFDFIISVRRRYESIHFWPSVVHVALYKTLFLDFLFRLPNAQNLLTKIGKKIAYKPACMSDRPEMFGPTGGFWGMADSMEPCKIVG